MVEYETRKALGVYSTKDTGLQTKMFASYSIVPEKSLKYCEQGSHAEHLNLAENSYNTTWLALRRNTSQGTGEHCKGKG